MKLYKIMNIKTLVIDSKEAEFFTVHLLERIELIQYISHNYLFIAL